MTFLEYVKADLEESQKDFHDSYVRRLQDSVQRVKANREMEERFMLLEEKLKEERAEGEKIGWKLGQTQGARDMLLKMLEILGEIPEPIRERITSVSEQETLTDWAKIAVQSASMEAVSYTHLILISMGYTILPKLLCRIIKGARLLHGGTNLILKQF